ncbi:protein strawberry notch homolog 1-like isoform X1 [Homarus americanus]|uniref:protein strawberry notch homolog 1-like isoform X1 n=1 Tax=Homarus americanus TaxID=6706 RepID=UPI001C437B25|nr:protein strawberry notch homolog 1-like isoform X1 [Homarus americanus]
MPVPFKIQCDGVSNKRNRVYGLESLLEDDDLPDLNIDPTTGSTYTKAYCEIDDDISYLHTYQPARLSASPTYNEKDDDVYQYAKQPTSHSAQPTLQPTSHSSPLVCSEVKDRSDHQELKTAGLNLKEKFAPEPVFFALESDDDKNEACAKQFPSQSSSLVRDKEVVAHSNTRRTMCRTPGYTHHQNDTASLDEPCTAKKVMSEEEVVDLTDFGYSTKSPALDVPTTSTVKQTVPDTDIVVVSIYDSDVELSSNDEENVCGSDVVDLTSEEPNPGVVNVLGSPIHNLDLPKEYSRAPNKCSSGLDIDGIEIIEEKHNSTHASPGRKVSKACKKVSNRLKSILLTNEELMESVNFKDITNKVRSSLGKKSRKRIKSHMTNLQHIALCGYLQNLQQATRSVSVLYEKLKCSMHIASHSSKKLCVQCGWPFSLVLGFTHAKIQLLMLKKCQGLHRSIRTLVLTPFFLSPEEISWIDSTPNQWWSWLTGYKKMGMQVNPLMMAQPTTEEEVEEDEDMGIAETYSDYMPSKLKVGIKHPDQVVETASMSSVEPPDVWYEMEIPDTSIDTGKLSALQLESITYTSQQHEQFLPDGTRAGFLIGDGAGVGKGRTIGGIIYENYIKGRKKSIWVSVSNDLKYDAERDLKDIGAGHISVYFLSKMKYGKINSDLNGNVKKGVLFSTYSALIGESTSGQGKYKSRLKQILNWCGDDFDGCIVFDECHRAKNLSPVGSGKPTKTGLTVLELQTRLPKARVVYASATGASEPKNMAYMVRLGIWGKGTPFPEFTDFISAVEKRGVGAMEIVAMDMKLRGMYIARQLSFHGVTFRIEEVPLDEDFKHVYDESVKLWVDARQKFQEASELINAEKGMKKSMWGQFWSSHQRFFKYLCIASKVDHAVRLAREAVKTNRCVVIGLQSTGEARTLEQLERDDGELSDFVSTAKGVLETLVEKHFPAPDRSRINKILGISETSKEFKDIIDEVTGKTSKRKPVRQAAQRAAKRRFREAHSDNDEDSDFEMSGDSAAEEEDEDAYSSEVSSDFSGISDFDDEDSWGRPKKRGKAKKHKQKNGKGRAENGDRPPPPPKDHVEKANKLKSELLKGIENLGRKLPPNTLDQLIDELGGPENVAEMTGRKGRVVQSDDGQVMYESRSEADVPLEILNIREKERFMASEKDIAIISEAASSGISLQSDRRVVNQRRRVHITLELPWSADRAIQQFGRTHRSNQVNAPEYVFLISELAGERRFASTVAKRLESLGALTHGDRRATESRDLSSFNIDNKYGRMALESTMKTMMGYEHPIVPPPEDYKGDFFSDIQNALVGVGLILKEDSIHQLDKDYNNMSKFLNRILGMPVELQNRLFKYFTDTLAAIITQAKRTGKFDMGILDLGIGGEGCKKTKTKTWVGKHVTGTAKTELHNVLVERGLSWSEVQEKWAELTGDLEGFYLSHQVRNNKKTAVLAVLEPSPVNKKRDKNSRMFILYRPNTGMQMKQEPYSDLKKKYKKVTPDEAQEHWEEQFNSSSHICSHAYWQGNCRRVNSGLECEIGLRRRTYHVLCGLVLNVWARVEDVLSCAPQSHSSKMQVVRLKTSDGIKLVGTLIPNNLVSRLCEVMEQESTESFEETFTDEDSNDSKDSKE